MRAGAPFGDYQLSDSLGRNPAAELFIARRRATGAQVVVSVLNEELSRDRAVQRVWMDEVAPFQGVDHRGLAKVEQMGESGGVLFAAWPHVAGPSLRELGESGAPWPLPVMLQLSTQLLSALEGVHGFIHPGLAHPMAHGDVRPSTLRIEGNALRLLELGPGRALVRAGGLRRTWPPLDYAPPERAREPNVTPAGDLYSATLAIWEHLLPRGATPPRVDELRAALSRTPLPAEAREALSSALGAAADRPSTVELRRQMVRATFGMGAAAGPDALATFTGAPVVAAVASAPVTPSSPGEIRPGAQVGPYEVLELLAAGGMGRVWRARHAQSREVVALKTISPDRMEDPKFVRRFLEEAKLAALLQHPNVVRIQDLGNAGGTFYLAMELLNGKELAQVTNAGAPIPRPMAPELAAYIVARGCEGLHAAHELTDGQGRPLEMIHRDVSMENIFLTRSGEVKLIDFGIAKSKLAEGLTREGVVLGKVLYMAPEQLGGRGSDRRVDLWALGVVLYWSIAGRAPFRGHSHSDIIRQILIVEPPRLRDLKPAVPARLEAIVQRAMARNPDDRYRTALQLRDDLQEMLDSGRRLGPADVARCVDTLGLQRDDTERVPAVTTEPGAKTAPQSSTAETLEPQGAHAPKSTAETLEPGTGANPEASTGAAHQFSTVIATAPGEKAPSRWTWKHAVIISFAVVGGVLVPFAVGGRGGGAKVDVPQVTEDGRASLEVTSTPRATATLDGRAVGATPLRLGDLEPGAHTLKVEMVAPDGSRVSREEKLELRAGESARRDVRFGRGLLRLSVTPWAEVEVDGRPVGDTPLQPLSLWEGEHEITLRNKLIKAERKLKVTIRPDVEEPLSVSLTAQ
ncbi:MAG TPA: protein kinase [Myxococcaceae bacterium]|jgi:serine/threonine-protein kinase